MKVEQTNTREDFEKLDLVGLHDIWFNQALTDKQVAKKFGITKEEVKEKRKKFGLNFWSGAMLYVGGGEKYKGSKRKKK